MDLSQYIQGGIGLTLFVILAALAKHHVSTLRQHRKDIKEWIERFSKVESEQRQKIEDLLKEQIKWVEKLGDTLSESNKIMEVVRDLLSKYTKK